MENKVTVAELDQLVEALAKKKVEIEQAEDVVKGLNKEYATLNGRVTAYLKELNRTDYQTPLGKLKIVEKWSVTLPKTAEEKTAFFDFLRERGLFDSMATVNANSLNAFYMREWKECEDRGEDPMTFSMPGIPAPKVFERTDFKPSKK